MTEQAPGPGHNQPPEPTPFELSEKEIDDLYEEARLWLDGDPIQTQEQADDLACLMNLIREAAKRADDRRKEEVRPLDEAKKAIQEKYAPLIAETKSVTGKAPKALASLKAHMAPWLHKLEAEKREAERKAREEAERKQREAEEAVRAANRANLAEMEAAEAKIAEAKRAEAAASRAAKDKAAAKGVMGRAVSLRTVYRADMADPTEFARFLWRNHRPLMLQFLEQTADEMVRQGRRDLPGVMVHEDKVAV